jgi:hypothetical protein
MINRADTQKPGISETNHKYLTFLRDIYEVSAACGTKTYIWGGFTTDIYEGRFLREHGDLDGFTENLMVHKDSLAAAYENRGYKAELISAFSILVIRRDGLHAAFNPLELDHSIAMWRHIGDRGTVFFPAEWLDAVPRNFYDIKAYTSGMCFEYGFRSIAGDVNPAWTLREKDRDALLYLERKLQAQGIDTASTLGSIWSYNPLWLEKGYDPFDKPVLVCPRKAKAGLNGKSRP